MSTVKGFVLVSSVEILGKVISETDTEYSLEDVLRITIGANHVGQPVMRLPTLTMFEQKPAPCKIVLAKTNVLYPYEPNSQLMQAYVESTSGILLG